MGKKLRLVFTHVVELNEDQIEELANSLNVEPKRNDIHDRLFEQYLDFMGSYDSDPMEYVSTRCSNIEPVFMELESEMVED